MARLDYFLISETLLDIYADSNIKSSYRSDHSPITLTLNISKHKRGRGNWKLNNSLLLDQVLKDRIEKEIELIISTYACTPYNPEFIKNNYKNLNIDFMIKIELLWEVLHAQLRSIIIPYASKKNRERNNQELKLKTEIEALEKDLHKNINNDTWIENLKNKKLELEEIRKYKLQGALIRSRWQNNYMGEKPSKVFLNLENKNFVSKHIRELKVDNKTIQEPAEILEEMRKFYENLYHKRESIDIQNTSLRNIKEKMPKLNGNDRETLENEITIEELGFIIKKSKNNKSPGPDGFTNEFYKIFWPNLKILLLKLLKSYRKNKILNPEQLNGVITCIPKGGKIRNSLKNWRPITLLNSIYKFYSGIIAERIKNTLPKLIHPDQKGFVNGRFIGENTRQTYDIINECIFQKKEGLILLIDFEKAFDSISWEFITKTLKIFNFGEDTINWINALQIGSTSKILQNGNFSDTITLGRGCRQGDPVSPYLFVLAAEILSESIRSNENIQGIKIFQKEQKISQYADDTTLFIQPNEKTIRNCMLTLGEFEKVSGLRVNKEKTKVVKLGGWGDNGAILCEDLQLDWTQEFISLGITYNIDKFDNITELNIAAKIKEIQKLIKIWNARFLTPFGKVVIIKSLLISKITHVLLSLPSPTQESFKNLEEMF